MTDPSKAVFLSYASQDAEAAQNLCNTLRAAGIEVWFDQSELRGGRRLGRVDPEADPRLRPVRGVDLHEYQRTQRGLFSSGVETRRRAFAPDG